MHRRRVLLSVPVLLAALAAPALAAPDPWAASAVLRAAADGDRTGFQTATGDLDGDGVDDLVVGAFLDAGGGASAGAVHVLYGPVTRDRSLRDADLTLRGVRPGEFVGEGPLAVLDLDGDGADELVVGAPGSLGAGLQPGTAKVGEAFLLTGGERRRGAHALPEEADAVFTGVQHGEWLGFGAMGVGDLDGDGLEDLALGAPGTAAYSGALYLFYGARTPRTGVVPVTSADAVVLGGAPGSMTGYSATGSDLDDDGVDDLVVAGSGVVGLVSPPQLVAVFSGGERLRGVVPLASADAWLVAPGADALRPAPSLAGGRDLTGDGVQDLVVGDPTSGPDGDGRTFVVPGGALPAVGLLADLASTTVVGGGTAVAAADLTRDGLADLVVGDADQAATLLFPAPLRPGVLTADDAARRQRGSADGSGSALAVGDVTGDGRPDVLSGAPSGRGLVRVLRG